MDIGATGIAVGLCDLGAMPPARVGRPMDVRQGPASVLGCLKPLMARLLAAQGVGAEQILVIEELFATRGLDALGPSVASREHTRTRAAAG